MNSQERIDEIRKRAAHRQSFYHTLDATLRQSTDDINYLIDKIEAQQREIERLNKVLDDWKYNAKCDADHIAGLLANKDEQAGRIMEMDGDNKKLREGLKRLRLSFQWLLEINRHVGRVWTKEKIQFIDALLGGKEDV
jgi:chromosome segregation ATPase